ncbi:hypothetical protein REPUB_Repub13aG0130200 [Reevesia pubescens]
MDIDVIDHHFDNSLKSALKAFQENYHLKVTGKIDHDTIKAMLLDTPRCGVTDVVILSPNGNNITQRLHKMLKLTSRSGFIDMIMGTDILLMAPGTLWLMLPYHMVYQKMEVFTLMQTRIGAVNLTMVVGDQFDLESVAMHEIGHALGLQQSPVEDSIMFATFGPGSIERNLSQDDIDGIRALYGT